MQSLYSTQATATGGRNGTAESADGRLKVALTHPVIQPRPATGTDPEQLFAAGYAACYAGACTLAAKQLGLELAGPAQVSATVELLKRDDGGFTLRGHLTLKLTGISQEQAETVAAKGHTICPYSHIVQPGVLTTEVTVEPLTA